MRFPVVFAAAVLSSIALATTLLVTGVLFVAVLWAVGAVCDLIKVPKEDRIATVFCGSKKSLASGVPMANAIFAGQSIGAIVLPLMLFHQIQLMACAVIASAIYLATLVHGVRSESSGSR